MKKKPNCSAFPSIFSPAKIGTLELKNRLVSAPMGLYFISERDSVAEFLARRARGGVGLVMVGAGMITPDLPGAAMRSCSDKNLPKLEEILRLVHAEDTPVGIQLNHPGRQHYDNTIPIAPSPIPCSTSRLTPRELTTSEVESLVEDFAKGALRAKDLGFDLVELHGAHGYLISQFLSPRSNQRTDAYGGDVYKRARFLLDILRRSRGKVGPLFPITVRINSSDNVEGGLPPEEFKIIVKLIEEAGADLISVSGGVDGSYPLTIAPFYAPQALYAEAAAGVKRLVQIPVTVGCRIQDISTAEQIVSQGEADFVILGRALIADPDLPLKAARGDINEIRPCLYCNQGCMENLGGEKEPTCTVNPQLGLESQSVTRASQIKKIQVIGGGVSGLEAAWVAASRGHKVTLYEESDKLGGQWYLAAMPPHKEGFLHFLEWLEKRAIKEGVDIKMGARATLDSVKHDLPDAVIVATGATPIIPPIPGIERGVSAWDVLNGSAQVGDNAIIVGGSSVGLETAHFLSAKGKNVTVLEMQSKIGVDMAPTVRWHLRRLLDEHDVQIFTSTRLKKVAASGLVIETAEGESVLSGTADIIFAVGSRSKNSLESVLKGVVNEVHVIGDAAKPRNALVAVREGWEIGCKV